FIYLNQLISSPDFDSPIMDAQYHDEWALSISRGDWIGEEVFFRAPLYPYFLAAIYRVFGHGYYLPRLIQLIAGSISCLLVYLIAKEVFNRRIGVIASLIAAFYGPFIYFEGELLIAGLMTFLLLAFAFVFLRTCGHPTRKGLFVSGLLLGLSTIARPNALILIPFVLIWLWVSSDRMLLQRSLILLSAISLIVCPVLIRNYLVGKDFVPVAFQGGINFYIGNNPHSDGRTAIAPGTRAGWFEGYEDAIRIAEETEGRQLKPSEISNFWLSKGIEFMVERPWSYFRLLMKKFVFFWHGCELSNNKEIYFFTRYSSLLKAVLWKSWLCFPFGVISPLFFVGLFLSLKYERERRMHLVFFSGLILMYMVSVVIFFVCARFRIPVLPFVIMFAAYALYWIVRELSRKNLLGVMGYCVVTLLLGFFLNFDFAGLKKTNPSLMHYTLGTVYQKKQLLGDAKREYEEALRVDPGFSKPYNNLGIIYSGEGNNEKAEENFIKAVSADLMNPKAHFNLGSFYLKIGEYEKASREYEIALRIIPDYEAAAYYGGLAYEKLGMDKKAIEKWELCLRLNPGNIDARMKLEKTSE
ncbi:hypothetical protein AMJ40_02490, partial [candidate division TA06 bacterium DG_26]